MAKVSHSNLTFYQEKPITALCLIPNTFFDVPEKLAP